MAPIRHLGFFKFDFLYFLLLSFSVLAKSLTHYKDMNGDEKCKNLGGLGVRGHPSLSAT